jgi:hypothetical protein
MTAVDSQREQGDEATQRKPWLFVWATAVIVFFAGLSAAELLWRRVGYRPSVTDSPALWRYWYEHAARNDSLALVGSSRMQAGISTARLRERLPHYRISQLATYRGVGPIGVLRELAEDERFAGIVFCDALEPFFVRASWDDQRNLYSFPADARARLEAWTSATVDDRLATKNAATGMHAAWERLLDQKPYPTPDRVRIRADRSLELDFSKLERGETLEEFIDRDVERVRARYEAARIPTAEELGDELEEINRFVQRIQDRGGNVVFIRLPSTGKRLALEEKFHPKATYWTRFAGSSRAICIHFDELAVGSPLNCADDSHLDAAGAAMFTDALLDKLAERDLFDP